VENVGLEPTGQLSCKDCAGAHAHSPKSASRIVAQTQCFPTSHRSLNSRKFRRLAGAYSLRVPIRSFSPAPVKVVGPVGIEPTTTLLKRQGSSQFELRSRSCGPLFRCARRHGHPAQSFLINRRSDAMWWVVTESNRARPLDHQGYSLGALHRRLSTRCGSSSRLSACDSRFVGPVLFTSELWS
jgi:hypothetical protein